MDGEEGEWKGPSSGTKRTTPKNHLQGGGASGVRDGLCLAARVVGAAGVLHPRTGEVGVTLNATLYYLPSASDPPNASEQAIATYNEVFIPRSSEARDMFPTAFQYKNVPLGLKTNMIVRAPPTNVSGLGWFSPVFWGWSTLAASSCVWIYNISYSIIAPTGYYVLHGSLLMLAWVYPVILAPL